MEPLITGLFDGFNAAVLAYGQTGAGKTYTMGSAAAEAPSAAAQGIMPRALQRLFQLIAERPESLFVVRVAYLEIYMEDATDLLAPSKPSQIQARTHIYGFLLLECHCVDSILSLPAVHFSLLISTDTRGRGGQHHRHRCS